MALDTVAAAGAQRIPAHLDPYQLDAVHIAEPPRGLIEILKKIGPGMVLAASIVGSGELIATTTLGAKVGYTMLWLIIVSCVVKSVIQSFLGRYTIARAETGLAAFNRIPGPRYKVSWVVWAWAVMVFVTLFQISAMFIGVSQAMVQAIPGVPVTAWVLVFFVLTLVLLLGGAYRRVEAIAMVKVGVFTMLTVLSAMLLLSMPQYFQWSDVLSGLTFDVPEAGLSVALATFGITGVGATELYLYTYWCVEKGYAQYTGEHGAGNAEAWLRRAKGWVRVMNVDVVCSMIIYTIATIAFYLLGAGILHAMGKVPAGSEMIPTLSNIYTETFGAWAVWVFYVGAIVVLYGTIFAATAGHSRMFADFLTLLGVYAHDDYPTRLRYRDIFIVVLTVIPVIFFFIFGQEPVEMVVWGGMAQAAMLPVISFGTIYLTYRFLPKELSAPAWMTALLWLGALVIAGFVLPSVYTEIMKLL